MKVFLGLGKTKWSVLSATPLLIVIIGHLYYWKVYPPPINTTNYDIKCLKSLHNIIILFYWVLSSSSPKTTQTLPQPSPIKFKNSTSPKGTWADTKISYSNSYLLHMGIILIVQFKSIQSDFINYNCRLLLLKYIVSATLQSVYSPQQVHIDFHNSSQLRTPNSFRQWNIVS